MFSDYQSHLVRASAYVLLALNWEVPLGTMTMALRNDKLKTKLQKALACVAQLTEHGPMNQRITS